MFLSAINWQMTKTVLKNSFPHLMVEHQVLVGPAWGATNPGVWAHVRPAWTWDPAGSTNLCLFLLTKCDQFNF